MKKLKVLKLLAKKSIAKILQKKQSKKENKIKLNNLKRLNLSEKKTQDLQLIKYEINECKNKFTFRANLKIKKDDYLSDKDTFEVVKLLSFLERAKRHIINHLDLNDIYEENEDEIDEDDENDLKKDTNKNYKIGF